MATFPFVLDLTQTKECTVQEVGLRTLITEFESGKEQRRAVGASRKMWTRRFSHSTEEAQMVWDFFQARQGAYESFTLQVKEWDGVIRDYTVRFTIDNLSQDIFFAIAASYGISFIQVL